mmetsp:Transcript_8226/g.12876  ORF Transcript_8226/g.12876 Transcript_8226/m.12876 type:complete len:326 (+) Transcript_8226:132-1109(+)
MSSEDSDGNNSTNAVVMNTRSMEDQSDALSLSRHSMPLQKDDDYFYYHGDGGKEDDYDEETVAVDHIGLLIGPALFHCPSADTEESEFKSSLRSMTSDVTYDNDSDLQDQEIILHYTTQECVEMKLLIADLKAQLDDQQLRYREKCNATISSLQDRIMSLECENDKLRQKLKESQDAALREGVETRRVEHLLQGKVKHMTRQMQPHQDRKSHQALRGCSSSTDDSEYSGEDFLPFPLSSHSTRNRQVGRSRPSLLDSMRRSFGKDSTANNAVPAMCSSHASSVGSDDLDSHYSWANADEINAQTGLFNKKSISKLLKDSAKTSCH